MTTVTDESTGQTTWEMGQDTFVAMGSFLVGTADPEALSDFAINLTSTGYSGLRMNGAIPNGRVTVTYCTDPTYP